MTLAGLYLFTSLIWGSTWSVIKIGLVGVPPFLGAGLRFLLAAAILHALRGWRGTSLRLSSDERRAVAFVGLVNFGMSYGLVYWAEQHISSGLTAVLFGTTPLATTLMAAFITRTERLELRTVGGILIGLAGTAVLFWPLGALNQTLAMTAMLGSACCASSSLLAVKRYAPKTDVVVLNAWAMTLGASALLGASLLTESYAGVAWTRSNVAAIVYLAMFGSAAGFLMFYGMAQKIAATRLATIALVIPVSALAFGWLVLGEALTLKSLLGAATVVSGVGVVLLPKALKVPAIRRRP